MDPETIKKLMAGLTQFRESGSMVARADDADEAKRELTFVASNDKQDSYGDRINQDGWDYSRFRGMFLWSHDRYGMPIASVTKQWRSTVDGSEALLVNVRFPEADLSPKGDEVYRAYLGGLLKSVSVGFRPVEIQFPKSDIEAKALGLGAGGVFYKRQQLLEVSAVTIGATPGADLLNADVTEAVTRGSITPEQASLVLRACYSAREDHPTTQGLTSQQVERLIAAVETLSVVLHERADSEQTAGDGGSHNEPVPEPDAELMATVQRFAHLAQNNAPISQRSQSPAAGRPKG